MHASAWPEILLAILLGLAAIIDLRSRRIPNWLSFAVIGLGLAHAALPHASITLSQALLGMGCGLGLMIVQFAMGAVGGGDVKLLAGLGAWVGPMLVLEVFAIAAVVGLAMVLVQATYQKRLGLLLNNTVILVINVLHVRELGVDHVRTTGTTCRSIGRPLPYAVPILAAAAIVWYVQPGLGFGGL